MVVAVEEASVEDEEALEAGMLVVVVATVLREVFHEAGSEDAAVDTHPTECHQKSV